MLGEAHSVLRPHRSIRLISDSIMKGLDVTKGGAGTILRGVLDRSGRYHGFPDGHQEARV